MSKTFTWLLAGLVLLALTFGAGYGVASSRSGEDAADVPVARAAPTVTETPNDAQLSTPGPAQPSHAAQSSVAAPTAELVSTPEPDEHAPHTQSEAGHAAPPASGTDGQTPLDHPSPPADPAAGEGECLTTTVPIGAIAGQDPPVFCMITNAGATTFAEYQNGWFDGFGHGLKHAALGNGYRVFNNLASVDETIFWRHNDHWMVDVSGQDDTPEDGPYNVGGAMMRPDRSFRFEQGMLVVEVQVAAGIDGYGGAAWPELVVTTAPAPTFGRSDDLYSYDEFAGHDTLGCRLQSERAPICALFDDSVRGAGEGGRVWEISYFQSADAANVYGGAPFDDLSGAWRVCAGNDPDANCRDTFRWEITRDRMTLFVNGVKYMEHSGFPPEHQLPERFLNSDVYVYFASWINKPANAVRFHWDTIAINPQAFP